MTPAEEDALVESCYVDCAKACVGPLIYLDKTLDEPAIRLAIRAAVAAERKAEEAARDAANGRKIMRLLASIFFYGDFTAETQSERELQAVMESAGWWPMKSEADLFAAIDAKGEA